ncbi:hypothetical protein DYL61_16705 [Pseudomonas nabeulensis]|uniref:Uncharacterized protein n=2 Tax=Pseudomonas TaxID=286 RepID=A0A4Z0B2T8_9PSED|nr:MULTISPECIES: hypothetical protein [Pseudomonas]MQT88070.1 hypothetical protein [Pseudomonas helleri]TFY92867.1 hypothetical protein DYL61_16705 [Pseudomonas nabeulensis]
MSSKRAHSQPNPTRLLAICHGLVDDASSHDFMNGTLSCAEEIGGFGHLPDALQASIRYVAERRYAQQYESDSAVAMATHVDILDDQEALILRGIVLGELVDWCMPARTRKEARSISQQIERLSVELIHQDNLVECETAQRLGCDHVDRIADRLLFLEGCLVAPAWRDRAVWALRQQMRHWGDIAAATVS